MTGQTYPEYHSHLRNLLGKLGKELQGLQILQSRRDRGTSGIRPPARGGIGLLVYDGSLLSGK